MDHHSETVGLIMETATKATTGWQAILSIYTLETRGVCLHIGNASGGMKDLTVPFGNMCHL